MAKCLFTRTVSIHLYVDCSELITTDWYFATNVECMEINVLFIRQQTQFLVKLAA